jgi:fructose-6-phosphate aldolase 2
MFYYDGIDHLEISDLINKGIIEGVTTNLTIVNERKKFLNKSRNEILENFIDKIGKFDVPLSIQVESNTCNEIIAEANILNNLFANRIDLLIKIPINFENLAAIKSCTDSGIKINATCITSFLQAKMATLSGAKIVSFFWGKMYDQGINPAEHVSRYVGWAQNAGLAVPPLVLVGSVRQIGSIEAAFIAGADVVTTSYDNLKKIGNQLASDQANQAFQNSL